MAILNNIEIEKYRLPEILRKVSQEEKYKLGLPEIYEPSITPTTSGGRTKWGFLLMSAGVAVAGIFLLRYLLKRK